MIVLATRLHHRAHILPKFLERRPPNKPPTIIDRMDRQIRSQGKGIGKRDQAVFEIRWGHFHNIELPDGLTLVVTEKRVCRSQSSAKGCAHFWWISADNGQLTVVDLQILLQFDKAPQLPRAFRSPIAAVEAENQRKAARKFRERNRLLPMIGERQVRETLAHSEIGMHRDLLFYGMA